MARKQESVYLDGIRKVVNDFGGKEIKLHGSPYMKVGNPDVIGVLWGMPFCIEAKIEGNEPSERQEYELGQWAKAGAYVVTATEGQDEPIAVVQQILQEAVRRRNERRNENRSLGAPTSRS